VAIFVIVPDTPVVKGYVTVVEPPIWVILGTAVFGADEYVVGKVKFDIKVFIPPVDVKPTADKPPVIVEPVSLTYFASFPEITQSVLL
jgi:hypothetical protein